MDEQPKRGPGRPRKEVELLPVRLLKSYWPVDGRGKQAKGDEIDLPAEEARVAVQNGVAVRNDHF